MIVEFFKKVANFFKTKEDTILIHEDELYPNAKKVLQPEKKKGPKPKRPEDKAVSIVKQLKGVGDHKRVTPQEAKDFFDLYKSGIDVVAIGKKYKKSHSCIYYHIIKEGERRDEQVERVYRSKAGRPKTKK